ncbi:hypothetical protein [Moorena sp. SIO3H5]|uniref:hypothetical protein n=1 Tax=Moorena sp. SIO3H5 TaxID=2607834 RepID=UPI0013BC1F06|nr:hypothetical protein [Moorena sp. SIO3H5]NEO68938.1 hypothetical protein [Moorena sp. SIO3H5]
MQRGLGVSPKTALHQDRCGHRFRTQNPNHERLHQDGSREEVRGKTILCTLVITNNF